MISLEKTWFFKYKPRNIDEFVFENEEQKIIVKNWIKNKKIDGNIILYGGVGLGKTSLAELLIRSVLNSAADLYKMKTRSVKELDENILEFIMSKPISSKIKIVYIEEADKLHAQSFNALKDGLLENYIENAIFIMCTNNIYRIPAAVRSRCTYQFEFIGRNREGIFKRIEEILKNEEVKYDPAELLEAIKSSSAGMRDILNSLQLIALTNNGEIVLKNSKFVSSNIEDEVLDNCIDMFTTVLNLKEIVEIRKCIKTPVNSVIGDKYNRLMNLINTNEINFELIGIKLYDFFKFSQLKIIIAKYLNDFDKVLYPNIHFSSMLLEILSEIDNII